MSDSSYQLETEAFAALYELMEQGKSTARLFEKAGLLMPAPLARMLGAQDATGNSRPVQPRLALSPLDPPWKPDKIGSGWIWLPTSDLYVTSMVLGILREAQGPMRPRDIVTEVQKYRPKFGSGSIYNVLPRLKGKQIIMRADDGWTLTVPEEAPELNFTHRCAWGPVGIFCRQEVAAHRRMVILHVLRAMSDGLMAMQLVKELTRQDMCKAKASKDLVKADLIRLRLDGKIRRVGNTKKWTIDEKHGSNKDD